MEAPHIPIATDDGLDPITLVWTGYAPASWVASNMIGWSDSAYCSGPKNVNQADYNYTLERVDLGSLPCVGPRDHVRIWDMGTDPVFGRWSIGSAHHERTVCNPNCHHVVDSWDKARVDVKTTFVGGNATVSFSNMTMENAQPFQGVMTDGLAVMIRLRGLGAQTYPLTFNEIGLTNATSWSISVNGQNLSSTHPDIIFWENNGTYNFRVGHVSGYDATPTSGTIRIDGIASDQRISFNPVQLQAATSSNSSLDYALLVALATAIPVSAFALLKRRKKSNSRLLSLGLLLS